MKLLSGCQAPLNKKLGLILGKKSEKSRANLGQKLGIFPLK